MLSKFGITQLETYFKREYQHRECVLGKERTMVTLNKICRHMGFKKRYNSNTLLDKLHGF